MSEDGGGPYPVGAYHSRGEMVSPCPCGGLIVWLDEGDSWGGSCYGQCGDYPRVPKLALCLGEAVGKEEQPK
jgi:hypothetical protein